MGKLAERKSKLKVEFSDTIKSRGKLREIIMEFSPYLVMVRLKGMRTGYPITAASIFNRAAFIHAEHVKAERAANRKAGIKTAKKRRSV